MGISYGPRVSILNDNLGKKRNQMTTSYEFMRLSVTVGIVDFIWRVGAEVTKLGQSLWPVFKKHKVYSTLIAFKTEKIKNSRYLDNICDQFNDDLKEKKRHLTKKNLLFHPKIEGCTSASSIRNLTNWAKIASLSRTFRRSFSQ